ncbi:hypothetical protein Tco_0002078 [Tanacetum coccineum]
MAQVSVSVVDEGTVESVSQLPRERLLMLLAREVCVDVGKVGEYRRMSRELRESVRRPSACIAELRALGDCGDGYETVRLLEHLRLENMEKNIHLRLMMKETQMMFSAFGGREYRESIRCIESVNKVYQLKFAEKSIELLKHSNLSSLKKEAESYHQMFWFPSRLLHVQVPDTVEVHSMAVIFCKELEERIKSRRLVIDHLEKVRGCPTYGWLKRLKENHVEDLEQLGILNVFVERMYATVRKRENDVAQMDY